MLQTTQLTALPTTQPNRDNPNFSQDRSWSDASTFSCNSKQVSEGSPTDLLDISHPLPNTKVMRLM